MTDILLINPPFCSIYQNHISIPLGLGYIASVLERNDYNVKILDGTVGKIEKSEGGFWHGKSYQDMEDIIRQEQPSIVGIGCFFSQRYPYALNIAKLVKKLNSKMTTVMGGIHPTLLPEEVVKNREVDFVILSEGEYSFLELVKKLTTKDSRFEHIDGIAFRKNGEIVRTPKRQFIQNLDILPFPALHLMPIKDYFKHDHIRRWSSQGRCFPVISSRSCPNRCHFCSMSAVQGKKWRPRSAKNVVDEIEHLISAYQAEMISFEDDNLTLSKPRMLEICEEIECRKLPIQWITPNGISIKTLDEEVLSAMQRAGCIEVNLAIESGDETIRNQRMRKNLSLEKIIEIADLCKKLRLRANAYFIIGYPGDNDRTINETIKLVKKLSFFNIVVSYATPFPGTELYQECITNNYIEDNFATKAFTEGKLKLFLQPCIKTGDFTFEDVIRWKRKIKIAFYKYQLFRLLIGDHNSWTNLFRIFQIIFGLRYHQPNP